MKDNIIILQCPLCLAKKEVEFKVMISKKIFKCENKKCKFGSDYNGWIQHYPTGEIKYPLNFKPIY